jgi:hypothetical protein
MPFASQKPASAVVTIEVSDNLFPSPHDGQALGAPCVDFRVFLRVTADSPVEIVGIQLRHDLQRDSWGTPIADHEGELAYCWYPLSPDHDPDLWRALAAYIDRDPSGFIARAIYRRLGLRLASILREAA